MNFLFHMLLSGDDEALMVGNFMGDFVKGPLLERFAPRVRQGVALHRAIDSFAGRSDRFHHSRLLLAAEYGRYRGVMVDIFYDYYLVNNWDSFCHRDFADYLVWARTVVDRHHDTLPPEMHRLVPIIFGELLPSYGSIAGIGNVLKRLSRRISRPNPLSGGEAELMRHHEQLYQDFAVFTPEIFRFVAESAFPDRHPTEPHLP